MKGKPISSGVWVPVITPYTGDDSIDYNALGQMIAWYDSQNVDGLFAVCMSSEMHHMNLQERVELSDFMRRNTPEHMGLVSSGHISTKLEDQIAELKAMAATGPDALVLVTNCIAAENESDEVWKANCTEIMNALPEVALGLYECPIPYRRWLTPELLKWCAETGRFAFFKDGSYCLEQLAPKLEAIKGSNIKLFAAETVSLHDFMRAGADGYCGIFANFWPKLYSGIVKGWEKDGAKADYQQRFATMASLTANLMYPVCAKYYMSLEGISIGLRARNRDYASFSEMDKTMVRQIHALWSEERLVSGLL